MDKHAGYKGTYQDGKIEGKGKIFYHNESKSYIGEWKDGKYDGKGEMKCANGGGKASAWKISHLSTFIC